MNIFFLEIKCFGTHKIFGEEMLVTRIFIVCSSNIGEPRHGFLENINTYLKFVGH